MTSSKSGAHRCGRFASNFFFVPADEWDGEKERYRLDFPIGVNSRGRIRKRRIRGSKAESGELASCAADATCELTTHASYRTLLSDISSYISNTFASVWQPLNERKRFTRKTC